MGLTGQLSDAEAEPAWWGGGGLFFFLIPYLTSHTSRIKIVSVGTKHRKNDRQREREREKSRDFLFVKIAPMFTIFLGAVYKLT